MVYVEIDSILPEWDHFKNDKLDRYNYRIKVSYFFILKATVSNVVHLYDNKAQIRYPNPNPKL